MIRNWNPWSPRNAGFRAPISVVACVLPALLLATAALCGVRLSEQSAAQSGPHSGEAESSIQTETRRLREGSTLEGAVGRFIKTGGRLVFVTADGGNRLVALENLALERVVQLERDRLSSYQWVVTGEVSEFQGKNFLFIRRATTRGRADAPTTPSALHGPPPVLRRIGEKKAAG